MYDCFQYVLYVQVGFGIDWYCIGGVDVDYGFDFGFGVFDVGCRQVDFVDYWYYFQFLFYCGVVVGY